MASKQDGTFTGVNPMGAKDAVAITPHDTTDIAVQPDAIYVGVGGDVVAIMDGSAITFKAVPVGILPIRPTRINTTNTTATDMVALYYK